MPERIRAIARKIVPVKVRRMLYEARGALGQAVYLDRTFIANKYLAGEGIEIGALHRPLKAPRSARVKYVDRLSVDDLRKHYPELADQPLVQTDIIDDGQKLESVASASQDFVIANHFLEHAPDPLGTVANLFRVLKVGGVLYLTLPDKRYTFDVDRPVTTLEHVIRDHEEGPEWSRLDHYREWAQLVEKRDGEEAERYALELIEKDYSIHFHVWSPIEMLEVIMYLKTGTGLKLDIEFFCQNHGECIFILRKTG
jgi:SAM-dependent methyltransferase